jgi:hypothetical protein
MEQPPAYGATRVRAANVSHGEVERAALDILESGRRPSVETVRARLGRGSPATIAAALKRFWRDLGRRAAGDPAALARLPVDIAELADGLWQRALALASQSARSADNAARARLQQIQIENELRAQSFALREKEFEISAREREKALSEAREQIQMLLKAVASDRETMHAQVARILDLGAQVEGYRQQLTALLRRAVSRNRTIAQHPARRARASPSKPARRRRAAVTTAARRLRPKRQP